MSAPGMLRQVLASYERKLKPTHSDIGLTLNLLARCLYKQGRFREAETPGKRALEICNKEFGPEHEYTGNVKSELAAIYLEGGHFEEAESMFDDVLKVRQKTLGWEHPVTAQTLANLACVYSHQGRHSKALPLLQRALKITEKVQGPEHKDVAEHLNNLALGYRHLGRLSLAEPLFERALAIHQATFGPEHPGTAKGLGHLAGIHSVLGDWEKSKRLRERALAIQEKVYGPNHHEVAHSLKQLALAYLNRGKISQAKPLLEREVQIYTQTLRLEHPSTVLAQTSLATIYHREQDFAKAEETYEKALSTCLKTVGEDHPNTIFAMACLASLRKDQNDYPAAESLLLRAIRAKERVQGNDDPMTAAYRGQLATLYVRMDDPHQALTLTEQVMQSGRRHIVEELPGLPETGRSSVLESSFGLSTALTIGHRYRDDPRAATLSAGWILNGKAMPQEASAEAALLSAPEAAPLVEELRGVLNRIAQLSVKADDRDDSESHSMIATLEARQQRLRQQISGFRLGQSRRDAWTSTGTLMSRIPFDAVLVNIARFSERDFDAVGLAHSEKPPVYVAWIVPSAGAGDVKVVPLGDAATIGAQVAEFRKQFQPEMLSEWREHGEAAVSATYRKQAAELSKQIFAPLEQYLEDVAEIIISPDSQLWTVPWGALLTTDDQYVIEKYRTRYVLSGRELVHDSPKHSLITNPVIFADPDYDLVTAEVVTNDTHHRQHLRSIADSYFPRLAHSAAEAVSIQPRIEQHFGQSARVLMRDAAQEATFNDLHRPRALVMSTHGYFEPEPEADDADDMTRSSNPLLRCGLALAGCNHRASVDESKEDGILTGLEIVGTDLRGTELVVLSACETSLGDIRNGDGVAGLRQAFQLAGAQSVVSSLWQVEDGETARLMKDFFANLAEGMTKSEALRQAKISRIKARRQRYGAAHPFFWAAFTLTGQD